VFYIADLLDKFTAKGESSDCSDLIGQTCVQNIVAAVERIARYGLLNGGQCVDAMSFQLAEGACPNLSGSAAINGSLISGKRSNSW